MPYRRLPSLLALRAFESVARNGSMKAAADELNVTPGAVSQLVKKLESEMDCELLDRSQRSVQLGPAGIRLQSSLSDAFMRLREAVEAVTPVNEKRTLMVACGPPFAAKWLVPRLGQFMEIMPEADIRVTSGFSKLDYRANEIDIGIRLSNDEDPSLERIWLGEESMMVMASPAYIEQQKIRENRDILRVPLLCEDT
ncbi:MAG: LysR family transcriptional regulator, partial [Pseudomonadota bacterium]